MHERPSQSAELRLAFSAFQALGQSLELGCSGLPPQASLQPMVNQALVEAFPPGCQPKIRADGRSPCAQATMGLILHQPQGGADHSWGLAMDAREGVQSPVQQPFLGNFSVTSNILAETHLTCARTLASTPRPEATFYLTAPLPMVCGFSLKDALPGHASWVAKPTGSWPGQAHPIALHHRVGGSLCLLGLTCHLPELRGAPRL